MKVYFSVLLLLATASFVCAEHKWYYSFISVETDIHKPELVATDLKEARIRRGEYAVNGTLEIKQDVGEKFRCGFSTYRSPRGNDDYKPMPWKLEKQDLSEFIPGMYKDALMPDLSKCATNAPYFEDEWEGIIHAGKIEFDMCKIDTSAFPEDLMDGHYKVLIEIADTSNEPVVTIIIIVQVEQKS